jgi:hypothetical protein
MYIFSEMNPKQMILLNTLLLLTMMIVADEQDSDKEHDVVGHDADASAEDVEENVEFYYVPRTSAPHPKLAAFQALPENPPIDMVDSDEVEEEEEEDGGEDEGEEDVHDYRAFHQGPDPVQMLLNTVQNLQNELQNVVAEVQNLPVQVQTAGRVGDPWFDSAF